MDAIDEARACTLAIRGRLGRAAADLKAAGQAEWASPAARAYADTLEELLRAVVRLGHLTDQADAAVLRHLERARAQRAAELAALSSGGGGRA